MPEGAAKRRNSRIPAGAGAETAAPPDDKLCLQMMIAMRFVTLPLVLLLGGSFARFRDTKWLFSHAGGTIPMMAGRINSFYGARPNLKEFAPEGIEGELRRLHYDTANATFAPSMAALMKLVPISQITYGTDYPYFGFGQVADLRKLGLSAGDLDAIGHGNATRLIPRLK